ncbi:hypothetical protein DIPPA_31706 [Diplonema papillatum]|nr:hypothetical protein DIPPA_31706 [Diplonema papillatum]
MDASSPDVRRRGAAGVRAVQKDVRKTHTTREHEVRPPCGADLKLVLMKKTATGVPGVEGWSTADLKNLPLPLLDAMATVFNAIERTGKWPAGPFGEGEMIPKDESLDPMDGLEADHGHSAVYRLWASVRLLDVVKWQKHWINDSTGSDQDTGSKTQLSR